MKTEMKISLVKTEGLEKRINQIFERYNCRDDISQSLSDEHFYNNNRETTDEEVWIHIKKNHIVLLNYIAGTYYVYKTVPKDHDKIIKKAAQITEKYDLITKVKSRLESIGFVQMSKQIWLRPEPWNTYLVRIDDAEFPPDFQYYYVIEGYEMDRAHPKNIHERIKNIRAKEHTNNYKKISKWM